MSWQATNEVRKAETVTGSARAVLYALAVHADRGGCNAFPSQAAIAAASGFCDRTVRRALAALERGGVIMRTGGRRRRGARGKAVVVWRILFDRLRRKPDTVSGGTVPLIYSGRGSRLMKASGPAMGLLSEAARRLEQRHRRLAERIGWHALMQMSEIEQEQAYEQLFGV